MLGRCICFIDGTELGITRQSRVSEKNGAFNGHKSKHALKYQTTTSPDGLIGSALGPMEGRKDYWPHYVCRNIEKQLENVCFVDGEKYYFHGDSCYNDRDVVDDPFKGAHLSAAASVTNSQSASIRVTVE